MDYLDATVYLKHNQTSSAGEDSKLGNFTMNYSLYADATKVAGLVMIQRNGWSSRKV